MPSKTNKSTPVSQNKAAPKKEANKKTNHPDMDLEIEKTESIEMIAIEMEEMEEQEEAESAEAASAGGNAAALAAAASGTTEMSASFKNFRHHPDMENFYRFIFENDLRHEALAIIDEIMAQKLQKKVVKTAKIQAH